MFLMVWYQRPPEPARGDQDDLVPSYLSILAAYWETIWWSGASRDQDYDIGRGEHSPWRRALMQ